jgi:hypothetical protein
MASGFKNEGNPFNLPLKYWEAIMIRMTFPE